MEIMMEFLLVIMPGMFTREIIATDVCLVYSDTLTKIMTQISFGC